MHHPSAGSWKVFASHIICSQPPFTSLPIDHPSGVRPSAAGIPLTSNRWQLIGSRPSDGGGGTTQQRAQKLLQPVWFMASFSAIAAAVVVVDEVCTMLLRFHTPAAAAAATGRRPRRIGEDLGPDFHFQSHRERHHWYTAAPGRQQQ